MAERLEQFSDALAETVAAAAKSVLRVEGRARLAASGIAFSGDGMVLTAHHVVEQDEGLFVGIEKGEKLAAKLVGRDPATDLALLKAEGGSFPAVAWTNPPTPRVGHLVLALGRPGASIRATLGIVSAVGESWRTPVGGFIDRYLQSDVVMYPGFSGGPLVSADGRVIGLNTSAVLPGASLTIPAATIERVARELLAHGKVRRGYLGITTQTVRLPGKIAERLSQPTGLLIVSVESKSPAEGAGLLLGDTLLGIGDHPLRHVDDLVAELGGDRIDQEVAISVLRGGETRTIRVTVGQR